jgi:hypothetical protein
MIVSGTSGLIWIKQARRHALDADQSDGRAFVENVFDIESDKHGGLSQ